MACVKCAIKVGDPRALQCGLSAPPAPQQRTTKNPGSLTKKKQLFCVEVSPFQIIAFSGKGTFSKVCPFFKGTFFDSLEFLIFLVKSSFV